MFLFWLLASLPVCSQTPAGSDHFLLDPLQSNPAVTGIYRYMPVQVSAHEQWLGMQAAPSIQSLTLHANLKARKATYNPSGFLNKGKHSFGRIGIGGGAFNFKYGSISQIGIHLNYAYHFFVANGRLSLGLAPVYHQFIIDKSGFLLPDGDRHDPLIHNDEKEVMHFLDAGVGALYYSSRFTLGFSVISLLNSTVRFGDLSFPTDYQPAENRYLARTIYAHSSYRIPFSEDFTLEPQIWAKYCMPTGITAQANLLIHLLDRYQAGILYRDDEAMGVLAGLEVGGVLIRYIFEHPIGYQLYNRYTTHQVGVGFIVQQDR